MVNQRPDDRTIFDRIIDRIERMLGRKRPVPVPVRVPARTVQPGRYQVDRRF
jgi:hypothetical protein